ncbi:WXG100 family type VII secretion target [Actinacidiphila alni]|uniref:WXG100 family type VII secretion target n=1 Tax=Actinacidiphila alni TaxID=380248 RepID=UPI0034524778
MDRDPTPGDPTRVKTLSRQLHEFADDVEGALRLVNGMQSEEAILSWAGLSADAFRDEFGSTPKNLTKLHTSYRIAADALEAYWPDLEHAQYQADKALADGRTAHSQLSSAQQQLHGADDWVHTATAKADSYDPAKNPGKDVPPPDSDQVRQATRDAAAAKAQKQHAQQAVGSAQSALDAAKRLAEQARGMREDAARRTVAKLHEASDAGIHNRHWWQKAVHWVADHWDEIVTVCKWIVAILGIVVMIIGGPLAWLVVAAAMVVLADTVMKYIQGKASLWDVLFAALDCIPMTKGITSLGKLAELYKAGGLLKIGAHAFESARSGLKGIAESMRALRSAAPDLMGEMGTRRFWKELRSAGSETPAPPDRIPDSETLSGDAVYFSDHSTAIGYDRRTLNNFDNADPIPGYHDVVVHGGDEGVALPGRINHAGEEFPVDMHPSHIADAVRQNPAYNGGPVRLVSCHSGTIAEGRNELPIAQQVANDLGVPVKAPTSAVGVSRMPTGPETPQIRGDGYWRTFLPMTG